MSLAVEPPPIPEPGEVYLHRDIIAERVKELGIQIGRDYHGRDLVLLTVLKGATIFLPTCPAPSPSTIGTSSWRSPRTAAPRPPRPAGSGC